MHLYEGSVTWLVFTGWLVAQTFLFHFTPKFWEARIHGTLLGDVVQMHRFGFHLSFLLVLLGALCQTQAASLLSVVQLYVSFNVLLYGAIYIINGIVDRHEDAANPLKNNRPFATGRRSVTFGLAYASVLLVLAFYTAHRWFPPRMVDGFVALLAVNAAYTFALRQIRWLNLFTNGVTHAIRVWLGCTLAGVEPPFYACVVGYLFAMTTIAGVYSNEGKSLGGAPYRGIHVPHYALVVKIAAGLTAAVALLMWKENALFGYHTLFLLGAGAFLGGVSWGTYALLVSVAVIGGWFCIVEARRLGNNYWVSDVWFCIVGCLPLVAVVLKAPREAALKGPDFSGDKR